MAAGLLAGLAAAVALSVATQPAAQAAQAAQAAERGCSQPPEPAEPIAELPWAQQWFAPDRVWPLSRGEGVLVAVVDTGVDADHPQLRDGRVRRGTDLLPEPAGGRVDCDSHGTAVASLIAAAPADGTGFAGLAPRAEILPVRVAERASDELEPEPVAAGIRQAVDQGAQVINLSLFFYRDHPAIADAVAEAVEAGVVVVAAVGPPPDPDLAVRAVPYPAGYDGVLGVGAIGIGDGGAPAVTSYTGPEVDLLAPGETVTAAAAGGGHRLLGGASFAASFVSAAAALLLAADPDRPASEVVRRLVATADPGPGVPGGSSPPVLNPYQALTERLVDDRPVVAAEPLPEAAVDPLAQQRSERWQRSGQLAALVAATAGGLFLLLVAGRAVWRRGDRRGWRPIPATRRPGSAVPEPAAESGVEDPERRFFRLPDRRSRQ